MAFSPNAETVYADGPFGSPLQPSKPEIRSLLAQYEAAIDAYSSGAGSIAKSTRALLFADLAHAADVTAWVYADSTVAYNGIYRKSGASGAGSWSLILPLPFSFIIASDAGGGTPNAIQATTSVPVSSSALVMMNVFEANTASPVTISFNGGSALTIVTNTGNDVAAGGLVAGMRLLGVVSGAAFRLVSDQVSGAIIAAAEAAQAAAEAARDQAVAAASNTETEKQSRAWVSANYHPAVAPSFIRVAGYATPADGGAALYKSVVSEPSHPGKMPITLAGGATAWYELAEDRPHVLQFGAPFDAINDFVPSLTAAMDYAQAKSLERVYIRPPTNGANYKVLSTIFMRSNLSVRVLGDVTFDANSMVATTIRWQGSFGPEINMNSLRNRGSRNISLTSAHNVAPGDFMLMISQRNALSVDAGEWQMGVGTTGNLYAYICEWLEVARTPTTTTADTTTARIFTAYFNANTSDPNSLRTRTTLRKASPVVNSNWEGGQWLLDCPSSVAFVMDCAVRCHMKNAVCFRKSRFGSTCRFEASFECSFEDVVNYNDIGLVWDYTTHHGKLNRFVVAGSQDCEFRRCRDYWGAQSFDLAYYGADVTTAGYPLITVRPRVVECETVGCFEAATSHPGVWNERWVDNTFRDCHVGGLLIRGLSPYVHGNMLDSMSELRDNSYETGYQSIGIFLYGGYAKNAAVEDNDIIGFRRAVMIQDAPSTSGYFAEVNAHIEGNRIDRCYVGLETLFANPTPYSGLRGIAYTDNQHTRMQVGMVSLGSYSAGTIVEDNVIDGKLLNEAGATGDIFIIETAVNNPGLIIVNNRWLRPAGETEFGGRRPWMVYVRAITDTTTYPAATWQEKSRITNNFVLLSPTTGVLFVSLDPYKQENGTAS
ncbi:hypothetical protein GOA86_18945 [Sinorhizobium meliloti]|nr:hypothetical protein [Sinorhizobium meliloti]MDW9600422.1 hypothetical protein [Sinorhizobium meliloti]